MAFEMTPAELECIGMLCSFFQNFLKNSYKTKNPKAKSIEAKYVYVDPFAKNARNALEIFRFHLLN